MKKLFSWLFVGICLYLPSVTHQLTMSFLAAKLFFIFILDVVLCSCGFQKILVENEPCERLIYKNYLRSFIESFENVNIISSIERKHQMVVDDFIDCNLGEEVNKSGLSFTLNGSNVRYGLSLIMIESLETFEKIFHNINVKHVHLVVILTPCEMSKLHKVYQLYRKKNIFEVYVLSEMNEEVSLTTYNPYSAASCYDTSPIIISSSSYRNRSNFRFSQKIITNFYGCPLRISVRLGLPSVVCGEPTDDVNCNSKNLHGQDIILMKTLAEKMNFSSVITTFQLKEGPKIFLSLVEEKGDIAVGNLFLRNERIELADFSIIYSVFELAFNVPLGRPYTSFEILSKPFQFYVWMSLVVVFVSAIFIISIVFDTTTLRATLNLISVSLGNAQTRLPRESSARILLMAVLMFTLVMRSLYQGSVFRFMQLDLRHKQVETIDEMIEEGFTFYFFDLNSSLLMTNERIKKSMIKLYELEKQSPNMRALQDPTFKGAYAVLRGISQYKKLGFKFKVCKPNLSNMPAVLYFQKHSFLTHSMNKKLRQITNAGLIDFWHKSVLNSTDKRRDGKNVTKVLRIEDLKGIFQILITGCFSATFLFLGELLVNALILKLMPQHQFYFK